MWTKEKVKLQIEHMNDYELKEILSWLLLRVEELEAAQQKRVPDRAKSGVKKSSSVAPRKSTRRGR